MEVLNNPAPNVIIGASFKQSESARSFKDVGREADNTDRMKEGNKQSSDTHLKPADKTEQEIKELKKRDAEVKQHEQAHKSAAGAAYVSGPHFEYKIGPDGHRYAVGGNVKIDTSEVSGDPEATLKKARQVKRAALAPADPSAQDRQVAAEAARMELTARQEIAKERAEEMKAQQNESTPNLSETTQDTPKPEILEEFSPVKFDYNVGTLKQKFPDGGIYTQEGRVSELGSKFGKINIKI